ncbi:MAG: bifunctional nuclease family protein, partial [Candidatus Margulisbacteria bacterium]|nr:bifunctional nuclease family protein [Candidatus Margulisiibacteriota bacterium]
RNFLPIWIGMFEAAAIAMELQEFKPPRPMTHDLIISMVDGIGAKVKKIIINDIKDDTFYALIEIEPILEEGETLEKDDIVSIDSRPSDAIALAVRSKAPIFVAENVMLKAKMVNTEKDEEETKKFKDWVNNVKPEDFQKYFDKH